MSATSEGDDGPQSSRELQAGPAAVAGVALVVLHQEGELGEDDRGVRGAADWDELEEETPVRLKVLEVLASLEPDESPGPAADQEGPRAGGQLTAGQPGGVNLQPVLTGAAPVLGLPQLEVEDPGEDGLVGRDPHQPAAVEAGLVVLGDGLGHEEGGRQQEHLHSTVR